MRVLSLWFVVTLLLTPGCAEPRKPEPQLDSRHVITVEGTTVRYNGKELRWDVSVDKWQKVLGPRSRRVRGFSVWDDIGIFLSQISPNYQKPESFTVLLGRTRHSPITTTEPDFWPKQTFRGRLVVDGALIHKDSTIQEINHDKKGTTFSRSHLPTIYAYYLGDYYMGLEFGYDRSLTSFSIDK